MALGHSQLSCGSKGGNGADTFLPAFRSFVTEPEKLANYKVEQSQILNLNGRALTLIAH